MELICIEKIIKGLDDLLERLVETENIQRISLNEFLDQCFEIVKSCGLADEIYFSQELVDSNDKLIFPIGLKEEIIGYIVMNVKCSRELASIIIQNLKYVIFIFLSFKELYNSISELKYIGVKFNAYRRAFYDISKAMLSSLSEDVILKIICQITQELVLCSACLIFFRNKVVYTTSNKLIEQELNFIIPELKNTIEKKFDLFYTEGEIIKIENVYLRHLKSAFVKRFSIPVIGTGIFILLFSKETELSSIDLDFVSTVTSNIATALETRNLFEQLAIKNTFLEKLFIGSAKLSEVNSFEELYQMLFGIVNDMFSGCDFVIFQKTKGEIFKPSYVKITNSKLLNFVEASELSLTIISDDLYQKFASYKSLIVFREDDQKSDLVRFFDLIFQRPYVIIPILDRNNISALIIFNVRYQFWVNYQTILDILSNHLSVLFSYVFSRVAAYEKLLSKSNESKIINRVIFDYSSIRDINVLIGNIVKEINNLVSYSLPVFGYYRNGNIQLVKTLEHYKSLVLTVINNLPSLIINKVKESVELTSRGVFKPILINNLELFFDNINIYDFVKKSNLKSLLILPIKIEVSDLQPVLLVFSLSNRFEQEYIDLLYSLANHFSIFFENASIYSFLEERLKATDILYNFLRIVTSVLDPYNVVMNAREFLEELLKPEIFLFTVKKYHSFEFIYTKPKELNIDYSLLIKTLGFIGTNVVNINQKNVLSDKNYKKIWSEISKIFYDVKQVFVIPIVYLREVLGYIIMGFTRDNINDTLIWILTNIPYALATPLKNSMIMQEQVEVSNIIRQSLITRIDRRNLHKKGIDFNYKHVASREITADWVELIDKKDNLIVIVADVSGKGAKSAIYTAQAKFAAKSLFHSLDNFEIAVNELNKILSVTVSDNTFITMIAINIYRRKDKVYCQYLTAGHEPLFVIKKNGHIDILSTKDIPLCIDEYYEYKISDYELDSGDILFLYTDGVIDIKNENSESFGRSRLLDLIKNVSSVTQDVKELTDRVYIEVMKFSSSPLSNPPDDITLVFIKLI
ncbi:MAG: SpoIIE family protein phosphatase [Candidatus Calescibacterium sp.]|nr:SpoIIE family protein phosphatase [Candidatus Calescibacterium sp.]MDW8132291.1 SpoIIE family protein phosphatase [Candidatus Calescibacterium sp.]